MPPHSIINNMKGITDKKIALFFVAVLFVLALIPAFHPFENETAGGNCPFCSAYGLLFALSNIYYDFGQSDAWIRTSSVVETSLNLPYTLPYSSETRAPPL